MFQERALEEYAKYNAPKMAERQEADRADIDFALALLGADEEEETDE